MKAPCSSHPPYLLTLNKSINHEENKNSGNNNNQKLNVERSPKKKQTTLLKDLSMSNTGELKKKTKKKRFN